MPKYVLGLCTMGNSSAALFSDNKLIAAVEEERLTRIKNDGSFPISSIREVLSIANVSISDVDHICVYWDRFRLKTRIFETLKKMIKSPSKAINLLKRIKDLFANSSAKHEYASGWSDLFKINYLYYNNYSHSIVLTM